MRRSLDTAQHLATQVRRDLCSVKSARTACVADATMEALIDSGASDHTVGRKALATEQLGTAYKLPEQSYHMATGTICSDEAVDLWVPV